LEILAVERLDLYEWNWRQSAVQIQSSKSKFGQICPAKVQKSNGFVGNYVLQKVSKSKGKIKSDKSLKIKD
jgi:hypothetical protein